MKIEDRYREEYKTAWEEGRRVPRELAPGGAHQYALDKMLRRRLKAVEAEIVDNLLLRALEELAIFQVELYLDGRTAQ